MDINFDCIHCGHNISIDESAADSTSECPSCYKLISVPQKPKAKSATPVSEQASGSSTAAAISAHSSVPALKPTPPSFTPQTPPLPLPPSPSQTRPASETAESAGTGEEALQMEAAQGQSESSSKAVMSDGETVGQGDGKPKWGIFRALSIYLVATFIWRLVTTAHEFPSTNLRNLTIGLDLFCLIGLIFGGIQIFRDDESDRFGRQVLFWIALIAGLGLFVIRFNGGTASWWTGHLTYQLSPRP